MPPRRSPPSIIGAFFLPLVAATLLAVISLIGLVASVPVQAAKRFGPPSPRLSSGQLLRLSALLLWQSEALTTPVNPYGPPQPFTVEMGESVSSIASRLQQAGLLLEAEPFRNYLQYSGLDTSLKAGEYRLSAAMTPLELAQALQDATPATVRFNVLAGWRLEEIARLLPTSGLEISPEAFLSATQMRPDGFSFSAELPEGATLEGFLFPGEYELARDLQAPAMIGVMLGRFDAEVTDEMRQAFSAQGLNLFEAVTLASIVEREAVFDAEMPRIASVYLNRRAIGMKLDADPTVQYALGFNAVQQTWWTNPLSLEDLQVDSPYNTYRYGGLPPGPICNPGLPALRAIAFPEDSPYYYFRAACDRSGWHVFAITFEEHLANGCP